MVAKMIGLENDIVKLCEYRPSWQEYFEQEKNRIRGKIGYSVHIEHIGSTSVSGMIAKPIIDILVGIDSPDEIGIYIEPMCELGYEYKGEAGVPFFYQSGSSFVQMYVGVGAKRVRDLFTKAKASAPSIIFIDEIDAIGKSRGNLRNDEREATLNQLLTEMDGFEGSSGVIVIGATNKVELLDEALLRPGRFDRRVYVELPGLNDRIEILKVHLKNKPFKGNLDNIAKMTVGFSGAALASLVNEASIYALKHGKHFVEEDDFYAVKDKVLVGKKRLQTYNPKEKEILSYYQACKAVIAEWLSVDFERISLVKDDFKEEDKEIISKTEMMNKIQVYLAGRVGVEDKFNEKYSNAHMDLRKARELAVKMIQDYAMGDSIVSDESEIAKILNDALNEVKVLYSSNIQMIEAVYNVLLEKEVIHKENFEKLKNEIF
jgi:ATP-dependent Zn protease